MSLDFLILGNKDGDTLLDLDVSSNIGEEYVPLMDDVTRMISLQVIIQ